MSDETIAAIATATGVGGIGIIRVSGKESQKVASIILGTVPKDRYALYTKFRKLNSQIIDEGIALFFNGPNSFTGEDVLELQCHGGAVILDILLKEILSLDFVRMARPGEFSERAFLNGKIDLTQAEAIADLINASTEQAALSAVNSLQGNFSGLINQLNEQLIKLRTYVEATIDFPDESIDFIEDGKVHEGFIDLIEKLEKILETAKQGVILKEGLKIVISGRPNAGKSSLLNALCEKECAIVTDIEGTTRDILRENINIDGMPLHIIDTAGLREHTSNIVEKIGIERAWNEIIQANRILFVIDVSKINTDDSYDKQLELFKLIASKTENKIPFSIIANKIDLSPNYTLPKELTAYPIIEISAKDLTGLDTLRNHLKECAGYKNTSNGVFSARRRHVVSLEKALDHLNNGFDLFKTSQDLVLAAEEMREAQQNLNEILGKFTADDLLNEIFNTFCIGK